MSFPLHILFCAILLVLLVEGKPPATTLFRVKHTVFNEEFQTLKKIIKNQDQSKLNFLNELARAGRDDPPKIVTIVNDVAFDSLPSNVPYKVCRPPTCPGGIFFEIDRDLPAVSLYSRGGQVTKVAFCERARLLVSKLKFSPDGRTIVDSMQPIHHLENVFCHVPEQLLHIAHRNNEPKISVVAALPKKYFQKK